MRRIFLCVFLCIAFCSLAYAETFPVATPINITLKTWMTNYSAGNETCYNNLFNLSLNGRYTTKEYTSKSNGSDLFETIQFMDITEMSCNKTSELSLYLACYEYFNGSNYKDMYVNLTNNLTICQSSLNSEASIRTNCESARNQCVNTDLPKAKSNDMIIGAVCLALGALGYHFITKRKKEKIDQMTRMTVSAPPLVRPDVSIEDESNFGKK